MIRQRAMDACFPLCIALSVALMGCGSTANVDLPTATVEEMQRIRAQPAKQVIGDAKVNVLSGRHSAQSVVPVGEPIAVEGTFHVIGEAASAGFAPQSIMVKIVTKTARGEEIYGETRCTISRENGQYRYKGEIRALREPGTYTVQARYKGDVIAETALRIQ